jgi:pimeloyl-ACP methyl ester carboxylesterase
VSDTPKPLIIFSHGNSFPGATYSVLFRSLRARGFSVKAVDKFGHDPRYPVSSNWPHLVQQLADFAAEQGAQLGQPVYLVGHSLGGFLSLMTACRHPQLGGQPVQGVLLLDSPILGGWRARALALAKHSQLVGSISPGKISRQRRRRWPDAEAALAHFQSKRPFARWEPAVLSDYISHGLVPEDGQLVLAFDREIETRIYNTLPHNLDALLKRHPPPCPVSFIGGTASQEMKQVGMGMTAKIIASSQKRYQHGSISLIEGTHLFPMEKPTETAVAIEQWMNSLPGGAH